MTRSSTGGGADNYNELRFEDKAGSEQVSFGDRTLSIGVAKAELEDGVRRFTTNQKSLDSMEATLVSREIHPAMTVESLLIPNGDGIDITSSSNVVVADCDIRTGDDAVVVGGYNHHFEIPGFNMAKHVCQNIVVTNCNLQSA